MIERFTQPFWDERYGTMPALWSGNPNRHLVTETEHLVPGTALDVGCGEGADAIWLAERGWRVTAADISVVALDRARGAAVARGPEVAARITWLHADLLELAPAAGSYDLVNMQYFHLPPGIRQAVWRRMAAAVTPGGTLLVVAHDAADPHVMAHRDKDLDLFFPAAEVVEQLAEGEWLIDTNIVARWSRPGQEHDALDIVVRATRHSEVAEEAAGRH
jgi:SAM-dependent methyltransferase